MTVSESEFVRFMAANGVIPLVPEEDGAMLYVWNDIVVGRAGQGTYEVCYHACPCCGETFMPEEAIFNDDNLLVCPFCAEVAE